MKLIKHILALGLRLKIKLTLLQKVKKIKRNIKLVEIPNDIKQKNINLWKSIDKWHTLDWLQIYASLNNNFDFRYISEQTYYSVVEPKLNNVSFSEAYADKNFYSKIIDNNLLPETLIRCIDGVYYDCDYKYIEKPNKAIKEIINKQDKIVCKKAVETGGGKGVEVFIKDKDKFEFLESAFDNPNILLKHFGKNFIIQKYIFQHLFFGQFNPSSVNTIRIFTYRSVTDNEVHVLHSVFRIGKKGAVVDNQASGGISCGVEIETAKLNDFAIDKYGIKRLEFNDIEFAGKLVPKFAEMKSIALEIATKYPYHRLLGFDFCVDTESKVKLIEVNNKNNEINFYQMNNGSLFNEFSVEILNYCIENKKIINLDFEI